MWSITSLWNGDSVHLKLHYDNKKAALEPPQRGISVVMRMDYEAVFFFFSAASTSLRLPERKPSRSRVT